MRGRIGRHNESRATIDQEIRNSFDAAGDHRNSRCHRFENDVRKTLPQRRQHEQIGRPEKRGDIVPPAREMNPRRQVFLCHPRAQFFAKRSLTHQ